MKTYKLTDINADNVIASERLASSHWLGIQRYRHLMCRPSQDGEGEETDGFAIELPCMKTSAIFEKINDATGDRSYHLFADVYARYETIYQKMSEEVDTILSLSTHDSLCEEFFLTEMNEKRGYDRGALKWLYTKATARTQQVDEELFRHLVLSFLIPTELTREAEDAQIYNAMMALKQCYCDSLDNKKNHFIKQQIYEAMGLPVEEASADHVDDIVQWQHYPRDHPTMAGLIDYRKSPQLIINLLVARSPETERVILTKIHDQQSDTPITTLEALEPFLYRKADWLSARKDQFMLFIGIVVAAPVVYWYEGNEKASIQFRATKLYIHKKVCPPVSDRVLLAREKLVTSKPSSTTIRCTLCECLVSNKACVTCGGPICFGCTRGATLKCYACGVKKHRRLLNKPLLIGTIVMVIFSLLWTCFLL